MIHHAKNSESFKTLFEQLYHKDKYLYISFGSKYNEPTFASSIHENKKTNAPQQLFPAFLQDHAVSEVTRSEVTRSETVNDTEILVISIDHYGKSNIEINRRILQSRIGDNPRVQVILYDENITMQMICPFFKYLEPILKTEPHKCMIANYIRFQRPNHTECYIEENLPEAILEALPTQLKHRFYQWFGYHPYLYNILYQFSANRYLIGFSQLSAILYKEKICLSVINARDVFDHILKHPNKIIISLLWNTMVDIQGGINSDAICPHFDEMITM